MSQVVPWLWLVVAGAVAKVAAHELSHAAVARLLGFRVVGIGVAGLTFGQPPLRPRPWLLRSYADVHPVRARGVLWRCALVWSAGPVSDGLVAAALLTGAAFAGPGLRAALLVVAAFAAASAVVNLAPLPLGRHGGTDGWWVALAGTRPAVARARAAGDVLTRLAAADVRPRDWPGEWVALAGAAPLTQRNAEVVARGRVLAYAAARDRGDLAGAGAHLEAALGLARRVPHHMLCSLTLEAAFHVACGGAPLHHGVRLLKGVPALPELARDRLRASAALAVAAGSPEGEPARRRFQQAASAPGGYPGLTRAAVDWLNQVRPREGVADRPGAAG
jgi:hypothetical protein